MPTHPDQDTTMDALPEPHTGPIPSDNRDVTVSALSGLNAADRLHVRALAANAMKLLLNHAAAVHYSQGVHRWDGIDKRMVAAKGQYPTETDCSATVTWALAQGLLFEHHLPDTVNGDRWVGGYTGTLKNHGVRVRLADLIHADLVLYGPVDDPEHVAMIVGHRSGVPFVISHGSEAGPFLVPYNYRPDANSFRRYI